MGDIVTVTSKEQDAVLIHTPVPHQVWPGSGIAVMSWVIGIAAILIGALLIYLGCRFKHLGTRVENMGDKA